MAEATGGGLKTYKSQPWILFDTIVANSFLIGDTSAAGLAVGSSVPAISQNGEMVFFNAGGRNRATLPWYTNLDAQSQLSYGLEVWQIYLYFGFPTLTPNQNGQYDLTVNPGVPPTTKLMEAILNFGVLSLELGQENQIDWPLTRFGAGGGLDISSAAAVVHNNNGLPSEANVMKLPEPIEMPRTQNLSARIRIAPQAFGMIGTPAAPGVGAGLFPYVYGYNNGETITQLSLARLPYTVQLGLVGRRVKFTQYGQIPTVSGAS